MTRLIDADALIEAMTKFSNAIGEDMTHGIFYAHIAPTIDAVPVSRIEKQIEDNYRLADEMRAKRLYDVANSISQYAAQIELFLEDWYEENDKAD